MKRTIALGAAWTVSAAAAVGLGFLAVSLIDADASPGTQSVAATTTSSTAGSTASASPTTVPSAPSATGEYATVAGTVIADCASGSPVLAGVPAAGWFVDDSNDVGEMEFKAGEQRVEVHVTCVGGAPVFSLDDSSRSSSSSSSSRSSSPPTSGRDDSSGRDGGGHGSDDGPGDDSSGRDGGGHGSDD